jgi:hypothetical protein
VAELTDLEKDVLAFERLRFQYQGAKAEAIFDRFPLTAHRYYQLVRSLLDRPEALQHDPQLVMRLRRVREQRAARRTA